MSGDQNYDSWLDDYTATGIQAQVASFRHDLAGDAPTQRRCISLGSLPMITSSSSTSRNRSSLRGLEQSRALAEIAKRAAENTRLAVDRLIALGARNFLISKSYYLRVPTFCPRVNPRWPTSLRVYNDALGAVLKPLKHRDGVSIELFDFGAKTRRSSMSRAATASPTAQMRVRRPFQCPCHRARIRMPTCSGTNTTPHGAHEIIGSMMEQAVLKRGAAGHHYPGHSARPSFPW